MILSSKIKKCISLVAVLCLMLTVIAVPAHAEPEKLAAFPGAEGGGMWTTGARGGDNIEVYHVYKLTDDGSKGTFRDAVSESNRIVVFDVAGNIELTKTLTIKGSNLTILGQTAPGDGICVKNADTVVGGDNVILRYMRFRMGDSLTIEGDTLGGRSRNNVIVDHCSISWSTDECASFYENTNFTMQWCIISESLKHSVHSKKNHGYGGIWGGNNASFHHNLIAHHDSRNPRIQGGTITGSDYDMSASDRVELADLRNNVIYNWGGGSAYGGQKAAVANIINCYYKYGPATSSSRRSRIFELTSTESINEVDNKYVWSTDLYVDGNYVDGNTSFTSDNSKGIEKDATVQNYYVWTENESGKNSYGVTPTKITDEAKAVHFRYIDEYPVVTDTAQEAYTKVLENAGASIVRDSVDQRVVNDVINRTGTDASYTDENGKKVTTHGHINTPSDVGGYPTLSGTKSKDSDNDGIPNEWEDKNGLDKQDATDGVKLASSGYTYVEEYANALADKTYVRDTAYDPDVPDYVPSEEDEPDPTPTPDYDVELVDEWKAKSGDEKKDAGYEFMPGLTGVMKLEKTLPDTKTFADGFSHNFAITNGTNGGWADGKATGCAMKYTAKEDGLFTMYAYGVTLKNPPTVFYAVPEGASDPATENIFSEAIDETAKEVLCSIEVEAGKTYYFYIAGGSKARFQGAKFERIIPKAKPYEITNLTRTDGTVTATVKCNETVENAKLLLIGYTSGGKLEDAKVVDIASPSAALSGDKVMAFVWNIKTLVPLAEPYEMQ